MTITVERAEGLPSVRGHAAASGTFIAVRVADTGQGISSENLDRIFEPFFTTKEIGRGTGLGLSQVFGFSKQSGGEVAVASRMGEGAEFTLYLPRVESMGTAEPAAFDTGIGYTHARVLLVEDNLQVGDFAAQLLSDLGHDVVRVTSAAEALDKLVEDKTFDVVFSDVVMPGVSGLELARKVRHRWPGLPVLLTSGYSHVLAQDARHGFPLLRKPYSVEELSRALRQAISTAV